MQLSDLIKQLQELEQQGHGHLDVLYRHGSSGDCGELSSARVTDYIDSCAGPFDVPEGYQYISVYAGN